MTAAASKASRSNAWTRWRDPLTGAEHIIPWRVRHAGRPGEYDAEQLSIHDLRDDFEAQQRQAIADFCEGK